MKFPKPQSPFKNDDLNFSELYTTDPKPPTPNPKPNLNP